MSRPTKFSKRVFRQICDRLAEGESLRSICRDPAMPGRSTVYLWLRERGDEVSGPYETARQMGFDALADQCLSIADTPLTQETVEELPDGSIKVTRRDNVQRATLMVRARLWLLERWCPDRYGRRKALEITAPDANEAARQMSDTERAARISAILEAARQRKSQAKAVQLAK